VNLCDLFFNLKTIIINHRIQKIILSRANYITTNVLYNFRLLVFLINRYDNLAEMNITFQFYSDLEMSDIILLIAHGFPLSFAVSLIFSCLIFYGVIITSSNSIM